jgi:predicted phosphodiesterase
MIAIQFISDIHLETRNNTSKDFIKKVLVPSAPYLALCGDIGYPGTQLYEPFLKYCSDNFEHIFYVAGNHEFYNTDKAIHLKKYKDKISSELQDEAKMKELEAKFPCDTIEERSQKIKELCSKYNNIHYLNKTIFRIPNTNIVVVGCTLWSSLEINKYQLIQFNDFHKIYQNDNSLLIPDTYNKMNEEDIEFLNTTITELNEDPTVSKIVVLTHHCPTRDVIIEKYQDDPYNFNSFFANDTLEHLFGNKVKIWLCGHTHGCKILEKNGTIIGTNTLGYSGENVNEYNNSAIIYL